MPLAYIALGANMPSFAGLPRVTLGAAFDRLRGLGDVLACSALYRTTPAGYRDQPDFLNAAGALHTTLLPGELLAGLMGIEREFGRERGGAIPNGPRTLDLDLLLYSDWILGGETLTLPHPRMHLRSFVLEPLAEIAPDAIHPILKRSVGQLLSNLQIAGEEQ